VAKFEIKTLMKINAAAQNYRRDDGNGQDLNTRKTTLSEDTDYENPIGHTGFSGEISGEHTNFPNYPLNTGYDEYLEAGNEI
jgi:hypothetical protein